jgi:tRNA (guanine37-N1)-methyltransferase
MNIDIISVVPELLDIPLNHSIMKRAQEKGLLQDRTHNLRQWAINKHGQVDDYQYGGGTGMVMMCETFYNAITHLQSTTTYDEIIYLTPDCSTFNQ